MALSGMTWTHGPKRSETRVSARVRGTGSFLKWSLRKRTEALRPTAATRRTTTAAMNVGWRITRPKALLSCCELMGSPSGAAADAEAREWDEAGAEPRPRLSRRDAEELAVFVRDAAASQRLRVAGEDWSR